MKFGAFYDFLAAHHPSEFDRVASGHYAAIQRIPADPDAAVQLHLSADSWKDQTYFLASLSQAQLSRTVFPLGNLRKVRLQMIWTSLQGHRHGVSDGKGILSSCLQFKGLHIFVVSGVCRSAAIGLLTVQSLASCAVQ